ncbi:DAD/Ost2, partial [Haematococcus lacustris]
DIMRVFTSEYKKTPMRVKIVDAFLVYALATAAIQFAYVLLVGTFPFNGFLAGFLSSLGFFALTVCLRLQVDPANKDFAHVSPERAFADYVLAKLVLHLVVWNYIG